MRLPLHIGRHPVLMSITMSVADPSLKLEHLGTEYAGRLRAMVPTMRYPIFVGRQTTHESCVYESMKLGQFISAVSVVLHHIPIFRYKKVTVCLHDRLVCSCPWGLHSKTYCAWSLYQADVCILLEVANDREAQRLFTVRAQPVSLQDRLIAIKPGRNAWVIRNILSEGLKYSWSVRYGRCIQAHQLRV